MYFFFKIYYFKIFFTQIKKFKKIFNRKKLMQTNQLDIDKWYFKTFIKNNCFFLERFYSSTLINQLLKYIK